MANQRGSSRKGVPRVTVTLRGDGPVHPHSMSGAALLIGSGPGCDISLRSEEVGGKHCLLSRAAGLVMARQLDPRYPLQRNGKLIGEAELRDGDLLGIGPFELQVAIGPLEAEHGAVDAGHRWSESRPATVASGSSLPRASSVVGQAARSPAGVAKDPRPAPSSDLERLQRKLVERKGLLELEKKALRDRREHLQEQSESLQQHFRHQAEHQHELDERARQFDRQQEDLHAAQRNLAEREGQLAQGQLELDLRRRASDERFRKFQRVRHRLFEQYRQRRGSIGEVVAELEQRTERLGTGQDQLEADRRELYREILRRKGLAEQQDRREAAIQRQERDLANHWQSLRDQQRDLAARRDQLDKDAENQRIREHSLGKIQEEIEQRTARLGEMQEELATQRQAIERELQRAQEQRLETDRTLAEAQARAHAVDKQEQQLKECSWAIEKQRQELADKERELAGRQEQVERLEGERERILARIDELGRTEAEHRLAAEQQAQCLHDLIVQVDQHRRAWAEEEERIAARNRQLRAEQEELEAKATEEEERLRQREQEIQAQHEAACRHEEEARQRADEKLRHLEWLVEGAEIQRRELDAEQQRLTSGIAGLRQETKTLEDRCQHAKEELRRAREEFEGFQRARQEEVQRAKEELHRARQEEIQRLEADKARIVAEHRRRCDEMTRQAEGLRDRAEKLAASIEQLRTTEAELARKTAGQEEYLQKFIEGSEKYRQERTQEERDLADRIAELEARRDDLSGKNETLVRGLSEVQQQLAVDREELVRQQGVVEEQSRRCQELAREQEGIARRIEERLAQEAAIQARASANEAAPPNNGSDHSGALTSAAPLPRPASPQARTRPAASGTPDGPTQPRAGAPPLREEEIIARALETGLCDRQALLRIQQAARRNGTSLLREMLSAGVLTRYQLDAIQNGRSGDLYLGGAPVLDVLHVGTMATTYLVTMSQLERPVAVRMLHPQWSRDLAASRSYEIALEALKPVRHPYVARVHGLLAVEDRIGSITEYVPGASLADLGRCGVPPAALVGYCRQAVSALAASHRAGFCHLSLRPSRILVAPSGSCKIIGYGEPGWLSKIHWCERGPALLAYLAPEQIQPHDTPDVRADLYATGRIFLDLVAAAGEMAEGCPEGFLPLLARLVDENPAERCTSVEEVLESLEAMEASCQAGSQPWPELPAIVDRLHQNSLPSRAA